MDIGGELSARLDRLAIMVAALEEDVATIVGAEAISNDQAVSLQRLDYVRQSLSDLAKLTEAAAVSLELNNRILEILDLEDTRRMITGAASPSANKRRPSDDLELF